MSDSNKNSGLINIALIAGGGLLLYNLLDKNKLPELTDDDIKLLQTSASELDAVVQNDTSPVIFHVSGNAMTAEERMAALAAIDAHFSDRMNVLADTLQVDPDILTNALTACMAIQDGAVREQSLELFFTFFEKWTSFFIAGCLALGDGLAKITASTTNAINSAHTCAQWTFVKRTEYDVNQTNTRETSVRYSSSSTKVVLGLLGSGSSQSSFHQTIDTQTINERLVTEFVPHCTNQVVDIDKVYAIMSAHMLSIAPLYRTIQVIADLAPRIESFVTLKP